MGNRSNDSSSYYGKKLKYKSETQNSFKEGIKVVLDAVPSLLLILIVIGGILKGVLQLLKVQL